MQNHGARGGHAIMFVNELPNGHDWMFVEFEGRLVVAVQRDRWSPELMAEAWSEYAAAC